jgi:SAM-dependent methyltransferase
MAGEGRDTEEAQIAALFARLRDEIAGREETARPGRYGTARGPASGALARTEAERFWAVTAERPFLYKPGPWGRLRGRLLVPFKAVLRRLMRWYVEPAFAQQRDFNSRVLREFDELSERADVLTEQLARTAGDLAGTAAELKGAVQSTGRMDRLLTEVDERLLHVERRVRQHGQPAAAELVSAPVQPPLAPVDERDYFAFESRMRGSSELIRERQAVYADEFRDAAPVLDLGCGRGEFLSLLREAGVDARGIDADPDMVAHCRDEGFDVELAEASGYLSGLNDDSLGGIFCAHVLEHLEPRALFRLLELAAAKLRLGGRFVAETPNPLSLVALANFSEDLSHNRPLHPSTLSFLARQAGFREVTLRFMSELSADERLRLVPLPEEPAFAQAQQLLDADVNRLNDVVFGPQDYAMLARA